MNKFETIKKHRLPVMELFGLAIEVSFKSLKKLLLPVTGVYLLLFLVMAVVIGAVVGLQFESLKNIEKATDAGVMSILAKVYLPVFFIVTIVNIIADTLVRLFSNFTVENTIDGATEKVSKTFQRSFSFLWKYIGTRILVGLVIYLPVIIILSILVLLIVVLFAVGLGVNNLSDSSNAGLFAILAVFFYFVFIFAYLAIILTLESLLLFIGQNVQFRKIYYISAIIESVKLIKGKFWKTLGTFVLFYFLMSFISGFFVFGIEIMAFLVIFIEKSLLAEGNLPVAITLGVIAGILFVAALSFTSALLMGMYQSYKTVFFFNYIAPETASAPSQSDKTQKIPEAKEEAPGMFPAGEGIEFTGEEQSEKPPESDENPRIRNPYDDG